MNPAEHQIIILDASIMINLYEVHSWRNLLSLQGYRLISPQIVLEQVTKHRRRSAISKSIAAHDIELANEITPLHLLPMFPGWVNTLGLHDATVLMNALALSAMLGTDDRRLGSEARRQGMTHLVGTEWFLAEMVQQHLISLAQGNRRLSDLHKLRFTPSVPCLCAMCGVECRCPR